MLQFAYTAKLLLSRENIQEVIRCAEFLRMHNLEDSCFRFLEAQLRSEEDSNDNVLLCRKAPPEGERSEDESMQSESSESSSLSLAKAGAVALSMSPRSRRRGDALNSLRRPDDDRLAATAVVGGDYADGRLDFDRHHGSSDLPRCPKYRKYQWACNKHNNDTSSSSHTSTSGFPSTFKESIGGSGIGAISSGGSARPTVTQIKVEPRGEEDVTTLCLSGDEQDGKEHDGLVEMELDSRDHSPMAVERPKSGSKSPTCIRALFKRSGELPGLPNNPSQQLFTNRLVCAQDKGTTQGEHKKEYRPFAGELGGPVASQKEADGFPALGLSLKSAASCDGVCKQESELDRRSVIFSSSGACERLGGTPAHSYPGGVTNSLELKELAAAAGGEPSPKGLWAGASQSLPTATASSAGAEPPLLCRPRPITSCPVPIKVCPRSPPPETRTRTSSSCSSYSYAEDGSGGSPCSLPQFEFSSSPCSNVARCPLTADQPDQPGAGADALFGQVRPKIKCEQSYGTNSSDESGSFSEGDSESCHVQEQGQEVSVFVLVTSTFHSTHRPATHNRKGVACVLMVPIQYILGCEVKPIV